MNINDITFDEIFFDRVTDNEATFCARQCLLPSHLNSRLSRKEKRCLNQCRLKKSKISPQLFKNVSDYYNLKFRHKDAEIESEELLANHLPSSSPSN